MATSDAPLNVPNVTLSVARKASNPPTTGAPSISSVTDNGDGTLTISGSNFGSKAQAAPITFERFEGGLDGQLIRDYDPSWEVYGTNGAFLSSTRSRSGGISARKDTTQSHFDTNYLPFPETQEVFASYYFRFEGVVPGSTEYRKTDGSTLQFKLARLNSSSSETAAYAGPPYLALTRILPEHDSVGGTAISGPWSFGTGMQALEDSNYTPTRTDFPSRWAGLPLETWFQVNMHAKLSTPGLEDGYFEGEIVKLGGVRQVWTDIKTSDASTPVSFSSFLIGLMFDNVPASAPVATMYTDDIYIDNTIAHVAIGDSADFDSCSFREICPASAWAADSLTVTKNDNALLPGVYYLFVRNSVGEFSTGYEVTI